tara:strand:- start:795 stop:956 length:162 start_codon:yes stop_codon:yes gene_type:complete
MRAAEVLAWHLTGEAAFDILALGSLASPPLEAAQRMCRRRFHQPVKYLAAAAR